MEQALKDAERVRQGAIVLWIVDDVFLNAGKYRQAINKLKEASVITRSIAENMRLNPLSGREKFAELIRGIMGMLGDSCPVQV